MSEISFLHDLIAIIGNFLENNVANKRIKEFLLEGVNFYKEEQSLIYNVNIRLKIVVSHESLEEEDCLE